MEGLGGTRYCDFRWVRYHSWLEETSFSSACFTIVVSGLLHLSSESPVSSSPVPLPLPVVWERSLRTLQWRARASGGYGRTLNRNLPLLRLKTTRHLHRLRFFVLLPLLQCIDYRTVFSVAEVHPRLDRVGESALVGGVYSTRGRTGWTPTVQMIRVLTRRYPDPERLRRLVRGWQTCRGLSMVTGNAPEKFRSTIAGSIGR